MQIHYIWYLNFYNCLSLTDNFLPQMVSLPKTIQTAAYHFTALLRYVIWNLHMTYGSLNYEHYASHAFGHTWKVMNSWSAVQERATLSISESSEAQCLPSQSDRSASEGVAAGNSPPSEDLKDCLGTYGDRSRSSKLSALICRKNDKRQRLSKSLSNLAIFYVKLLSITALGVK